VVEQDGLDIRQSRQKSANHAFHFKSKNQRTIIFICMSMYYKQSLKLNASLLLQDKLLVIDLHISYNYLNFAQFPNIGNYAK